MGNPYKIYTKGGDQGKTSLLGGTRVPKYDPRIEAYGTLDELNSFIGLIRDHSIPEKYKNDLLQIQQIIFAAESNLAADKPENKAHLPQVTEEDIAFLEQEIDKMDEFLPALKSFILPGGHVIVSYCHVARTVCRRAERLTTRLAELFPVDTRIIKYLNRLSDYFFTLARMLAREFNAPEIPWKPHK